MLAQLDPIAARSLGRLSFLAFHVSGVADGFVGGSGEGGKGQ